MRLGHYEFDTTIDEYHKNLADIVNNKKTLIFFDTNILAYLYKLHANARSEFYAWSDSIIKEERLFLPSWAASEYANRVTTNKLEDYTSKNDNVSPDKAKKMYLALYEMASLFLDDDILSRNHFEGDRNQFLDEFLSTIKSLDKYTMAFNTQFKVGDVHNEITSLFSQIVLNSNLTELCAKANREGDARFEHRLPPGFKDGGKGENRFGDLIIWYEILEQSKNLDDKFDHIIFLSNDEKSDWVYSPKFRAVVHAGNRKQVSNKNPIIKVADPRLVAEFNNTIGHSNFTICSLALLIESLSKIDPKRFTNLAGAIQINIQENKEDTEHVGEGTKPAQEEIVPAQEYAELVEEEILPAQEDAELANDDDPVFIYTQEALSDSLYEVDLPSEINEIIRALKSYNWYTQNPAISKISSIVDENLDASSCFVLGRNIYQAACGNSQKAIEYMTSLSRKLQIFPDEIANHILAGMAFEIYFDSKAQYRTSIKFDYASNVLSLLATDNFEPAKNFIRHHLQAHKDELLFMPGDQGEPKQEITINAALSDEDDSSFVLTSVVFNNKELIDDEDEPFWPYSSEYSVSKIRTEISSTLAIPKWALILKFNNNLGDKCLKLPQGKVLTPLNAVKL